MVEPGKDLPSVSLIEQGADLVDIGGESTRPGFRDVTAEEEIRRILPIVERVAGTIDVPVSIDTRKAAVARAALSAGATIVNDVSGLSDPDMAPVAAEASAGLVIVHGRRAEPGENIVHALVRDLDRAVNGAIRAGVTVPNILVDPGLGFGKDWRDNFAVLRRLSELRRLGLPIVGHIPLIEPVEDIVQNGSAQCPADALLWSYYRPQSAEAECYRGVRTALYFAMQGKEVR